MADLFDVKMGGAGWHLTSHLIAIAALFVACFAITGYISFRDTSVPGSALKDQDADFEDITADTISLGDAYHIYTRDVDLTDVTPSADNDVLAQLPIKLPANGHIISASLSPVVLSNVATLDVDLELSATNGTAVGTGAATPTAIVSTCLLNSGGTAGAVVVSDNTAVFTDIAALQYVYLSEGATNTATKLTSGTVRVSIVYVGAKATAL